MGLGHGADDDDDSSPSAAVIGAEMERVDVHELDTETQQFLVETYMENLGVDDFLGFGLATLAFRSSGQSQLPRMGESSGTRSQGKMGHVGATITTVKSFVGTGILTMPFAYRRSGLLSGTICLLLIAFVSEHCMQLLLRTAATSGGRPSFGNLAMRVCGRRAKLLVEGCLIFSQYGFCIGYVIFIVWNVQDVVCHETNGIVCPQKGKLFLATVVFLAPSTWLSSLNMLEIPVLMSNFAILAMIVWIFYCSIAQIYSGGVAAGVVVLDLEDLPLFFGMVIGTFEGIGMILPIQAAMEEPVAFPTILRRVIIVLCSVYVAFGFFGYVAYGLDTKSMVPFNLPQNKITSFLRLFYCLSVSFTYPVQLFPLYGITEARLKCLKDPRLVVRRILFRTLLVVLTGVIGMQIPNFGLFLGLIGSIACTLLAFILPAFFHLKRVDRSDASGLEDAKDVILIGFGAVAGIVSFTLTLKELFSSSGADESGGGHR